MFDSKTACYKDVGRPFKPSKHPHYETYVLPLLKQKMLCHSVVTLPRSLRSEYKASWLNFDRLERLDVLLVSPLLSITSKIYKPNIQSESDSLSGYYPEIFQSILIASFLSIYSKYRFSYINIVNLKNSQTNL